MNRIAFQSAAIALASLVALQTVAEKATRLSVGRSNAGLELSWPAIAHQSDGSVVRPYFELQRSSDLQQWLPIGERQRAAASVPEAFLKVTLSLEDPHAFYRLMIVQPGAAASLGSGGAEVFGYGESFARELRRIGQISPDQFATMFPNSANYLSGISWDPTTAQFWDQFNADIEIVNQGKNPGDPGYRTVDFRMNSDELQSFKTNGFVVSERLGANSFASVFYDLFHNDLPVFISTDALL